MGLLAQWLPASFSAHLDSDPFPYNLYSWILPDELKGKIAGLVQEGSFPDPSILRQGLIVGVVLTVVRLILTETALRPLAHAAIGVQPK